MVSTHKYPEAMQKSIELVKETRTKRQGVEPKKMSLEEREEILKKFHPDYKEGVKRPVLIGSNKDDLMSNEVADLLESEPLINVEDIDLSRIDYDVDILLIGGGGAGIIASLWAHYSGIDLENILLVTKLRLGDSNSKMSQGGIQAAVTPDDSPAIHYIDAIGGGHFTNKPEIVETLVKNAPEIIAWHEKLGVIYDKHEDGTFLLNPGGGTSKDRLLSCKDYTGLEIVRVIMDEFRNTEIPFLEFTSAVELLMDEEGKAAGAILYDMETKEYFVARSKATILATGGFGRLHIQDFPTTNHYGATADGLVLAYRAGAKLRDLDAVQYHPTGSAYPEQIVGLLCTEKLRGMGAQPVNKNGELFVHPLEPRDVESAVLLRECYEKGNGLETPTGMIGLWLDIPMIDILNGVGTIEERFSAMFIKYKRFDIDITEDPVLVFPTIHYQNGGVEINKQTETNVPGLFAAGEVTGGVHGKNRLMGNSILDYNVFGKIAGINASEYAKKIKIGKLTLDHVKNWKKTMEGEGITTRRKAPMLLPEYRGEKTLSRLKEYL